MDKRDCIRYTLDGATETLCNNLDPAKILLRLKTKHILSDDDVREIRHPPRYSEKVEKLLETLKQRGPVAYDEFMSALAEFRCDLYKDIKAIEDKFLSKFVSLRWLATIMENTWYSLLIWVMISKLCEIPQYWHWLMGIGMDNRERARGVAASKGLPTWVSNPPRGTKWQKNLYHAL